MRESPCARQIVRTGRGDPPRTCERRRAKPIIASVRAMIREWLGSDGGCRVAGNESFRPGAQAVSAALKRARRPRSLAANVSLWAASSITLIRQSVQNTNNVGFIPSWGMRWTMRRSLIEWLFISAAGFFLATVALLAFSSHPSWSAIPLDLAQHRGGHSVYVLIWDGRAGLFNQIDFNSPGSPKPLVVNPRTFIFPKVTANHQFSIPGLAFQFCRFGTGSSIWSLDFSLAIPAVLSLIAAALLFRRLRRAVREIFSFVSSLPDLSHQRSGASRRGRSSSWKSRLIARDEEE